MPNLTHLTPAAWGAIQSPPVGRLMAALYCRTGRLVRPNGEPGCYRLGRGWAVWPDAVIVGGRKPSGNPNWKRKQSLSNKTA